MRFLVYVLVATSTIALLPEQAVSRSVDLDPYYEDEAGIPDVVYLFIWVAVCAAIASLYKLLDKFNKADPEISEKVFNTVVVGSMAGAWHGFLITCGLIIVSMLVDAVSNLDLSSVILQKTNLIVLFFAAVNVGGLMYVLRNGEDVIIRTKDMQIIYRDED